MVSIPLEQGGVFRHAFRTGLRNDNKSQSLWNRAGSFDELDEPIRKALKVSIPLEQGGVFRPARALDMQMAGSQSLWNRAGSFDGENVVAEMKGDVSIPLEQGGVFRRFMMG